MPPGSQPSGMHVFLPALQGRSGRSPPAACSEAAGVLRCVGPSRCVLFQSVRGCRPPHRTHIMDDEAALEGRLPACRMQLLG
jgi:hypothetical protein